VLSHSVKEAPENLQDKVEMYSGDIRSLISQLERNGFKHAYIDGGTPITSFINLQLINEIIITKAPILLGKVITLFGELSAVSKLITAEATAFKNDFIQMKYTLSYL
jgi:dihydrofolate reductase